MEKISKLRQIIREEIMKEIAVGSMARGQLSGGSGPLLDAVKTTFGLEDDDLGRPEFDNKNNIIYFPEGELDGLFATWKKPSNTVTINGETLNSTKWKEIKNKGKIQTGAPFYYQEL
jgi:hypothetical protein